MKPSRRKTHSLILTIASIIAACMVIAVALFAAMGNYFVNEFRSYRCHSLSCAAFDVPHFSGSPIKSHMTL